MSFLVGVPGKLKTLLDRLTAVRAGFLDYIDSLNTRWDTTAKTNFGTLVTNVSTLITRLTAVRAANLDNVGQITTQRFYGIELTGIYADQAIDSVIVAKSSIELQWSVEGSGPTQTMGWDGSHWTLTFDQRPYFPRAEFTGTGPSSNNVRIKRGAAGSPAVTLKCNLFVSTWATS
jgi:hypothetical protein